MYIYLIGTEIYARILQWIKAIRRSSPVKFHFSRCWLGERRFFTSEILSFVFRSTEVPQNLTFDGQNFADKSQYQWNKQITSWKVVLCTIFIHSLKRIRKLTRSLRSLVRFPILLNSWIKIVRTHFPWSNFYISSSKREFNRYIRLFRLIGRPAIPEIPEIRGFRKTRPKISQLLIYTTMYFYY